MDKSFLEEAELQTISYTKADGEVVTRDVIPTQVPSDLVTTVDVTELSAEERDQMLSWITDYTTYVDNVLSTIFTLEDFIEQASNETPTVKWRRYYKANIEICGED